MIRAMKKMAGDLLAGTLKKEDITEDVFAGYLDTKGIPEPDLMIRTSGEAASVKFYALAAGLHRILFYRCALAGFQ